MTASSSLTMSRPNDAEFFERELKSFLPDRVFDAHCHVWNDLKSAFGATVGPRVGYAEYAQLMQDIHPGRDAAGLFIPVPFDTDDASMAAVNAWTAKATADGPNCRGLFFIRPDQDPEWVRQEVTRLKLHGLKCYHLAALETRPTWTAPIPDFLPESMVKVAHEEGWVITLHMVRDRAAADALNIECIRHYCQTYPNMTLILAHSARGFQPAHNLEGLPKLTGLDNLYFDTSANCDAIAHQSILRIIGHDKLMYGTDLPVSHGRGRSVPVTDTFLWLSENAPVWEEVHQTVEPVLLGLEHLRSIKWACWAENMTDSQVEDIFYNTAARVFGLDE